MKIRTTLLIALAAASLPQASAQLALYTVTSGVSTPVANGQFLQFPAVAAGWEATDVTFNVQYTGSASPYYLTYFHLQDGTPFTLLHNDWTSLPASFPAGGLNFTMRFQPALNGSYAAKLEMYGTEGVDNIVIQLTGTAYPGFTPSAPSLSFGSVQVGSSQTLPLTLTNNNQGAPLTIGEIAFESGTDFHLAMTPTEGTMVAPGDSTALSITFEPTSAGLREDTLTIGWHSFPVSGTGVAGPPPIFPQPSIQLNLPTTASGQQGSLSVSLAAAAPVAGNGTITLVFQPSMSGFPDDPMVAFSDSTRTAAFTVSQGSSTGQFAGNASVGFQTGTTAGTLTFTLQLGSSTAQASVTIAPAVIITNPMVAVRNVGCVASQSYCNTSNVQLQIDGWDNTRSASQAIFRFFNQSGQQISPGDITWNGTTEFQSYFVTSTVGGEFELSGIFPISGDGAKVTAAEVTITNSVGASQTARVQF